MLLAHSRSPPEMYRPTASNGEDERQALMAPTDGAWHASKPSPVCTSAASAGVADTPPRQLATMMPAVATLLASLPLMD